MSDLLDDEVPQLGPRKRTIRVQGRSTSIALTDALWGELQSYAEGQGVSLNQLVTQIRDGDPGNLNRAVRLYIVNERMGRRKIDK
jgi:predicted DNA-binding ribbon-helix-helix protein